MERWAPFPQFEGKYEISDHGNIRRCSHVIINSKGHAAYYPQRPLIPFKRKSGHMHIRLSAHDIKYTAMVHQAVARAFIGPRPDSHEINHKDDDPTNNHWSNLEYVTHLENIAIRDRKGRQSKGDDHPRAKLTCTDIPIVRSRLEGGDKLVDIAFDYGVSAESIRQVKIRKTWRHVL